MDRYLISGVLGLLILQIAFLLSSLGLIAPFDYVNVAQNSDRRVIGKMINKRQNVKHKAADSIIWEDANANDALYRYDSILTLDHSSAHLDLEERVSLHVEENTLVMLEPVVAEENDTLRVRFYKGQMRARNRQRLSFGTGGWSMEATPGTDMTLRSLDNERVELEIAKGTVALSNKSTGESKTYSDGKKLTLAKETIDAVQEVISQLKIDEPQIKRIYSHMLPVRIPVEWTGEATKLHVVNPDGQKESFAVGGASVELMLGSGNHALTLEDIAGRLSSTSVLEIIPAPRLQYLSPLPRDRAEVGNAHLFSWYPIDGASNYELQFQRGRENFGQKSKLPYSRATLTTAGEYSWSVTAFDADSIPIPPYYSLPVYFTPAPLAAPKLGNPIREAEPRKPANETETPDNGASYFIRKYFHYALTILLPRAVADEYAPPILFSWSPVDGADLYVIEISSSPDFLKPEVMTRTQKKEFAWKTYARKVYYWRVAGESKDGRMGLFSAAEKFDVTTLKSATGGSGPRFGEIKTVKAAGADPRLVEAATPEKPGPVKVSEPAPITDAPSEAKSSAPTYIEIKGLVDYWLMQQSAADINKSSFQGLAVPSLGLAKSWSLGSSAYVTEAQMQTLKWEPKSEDELPFQNAFTTTLFTLKASQINRNGLDWGFVVKQIPVLNRSSLEQVEPEITIVYGPSAKWNALFDSGIEYEAEFSLSYGDGLIQPSLQNTATYRFDGHSSVGALFELSGAFGDQNRTLQWLRFGLQYGFRW